MKQQTRISTLKYPSMVLFVLKETITDQNRPPSAHIMYTYSTAIMAHYDESHTASILLIKRRSLSVCASVPGPESQVLKLRFRDLDGQDLFFLFLFRPKLSSSTDRVVFFFSPKLPSSTDRVVLFFFFSP